MPEYINVKIPLWYREKFDRLNKEYDLGYVSLPELVKELLRAKYREVEGAPQEE